MLDLFFFILFLPGCSWVPDKLQDNPVEEFIEKEIESETGIKIDFTGKTPE